MKRLIYTQTNNKLSLQDIETRINEYQVNTTFTLTSNEEEIYVDFNEDVSTENLMKIDLSMCTLTYFRK